MAKVTGLFNKLEGTLDGVTFYKSEDGHLARMKGGVSAERIATDPAFERTRENGAEFGAAASAGKLVRRTLRPLIGKAGDSKLTSRMTKVMAQIKKYDANSDRGKRSVAEGIADPAAMALLKDFNFNRRATLDEVLFAPFAVNQTSGAISLTGFKPAQDMNYPQGATHVKFLGGYANIDFTTGAADLQFSASANTTIDNTPVTITLTPSAAPPATGTNMFVLQVEFFQEVNGTLYPLSNGQYNVLTIVDIA